MKSSQEIHEVGRRARTFSLGTAGSKLEQELETFFWGGPSCQPMGLASSGFYVSKKTLTYTPGKQGMQPAHRAGISEINLSIGAGLKPTV